MIPRRPVIVAALGAVGAVAVVAGSAESRAARRGAAAFRDGTGHDWRGLDAGAKRSLARRYLRSVGRRDIVPADVVEATDDFVAELGADVTARTPMRALIDSAVRAADEREWAAVIGDHPAPVRGYADAKGS